MPISFEQIGATIAGGSAVIMSIGLGLSKLGLLRLGKSKNSQNPPNLSPLGKCPDPDCQREVIEIATSHKILVDQWKGTDAKLDVIGKEVGELKTIVVRLEDKL